MSGAAPHICFLVQDGFDAAVDGAQFCINAGTAVAAEHFMPFVEGTLLLAHSAVRKQLPQPRIGKPYTQILLPSGEQQDCTVCSTPATKTE